MNNQENDDKGVKALRFCSTEQDSTELTACFQDKLNQNSMYVFASRTGKGSVAVARTEYSSEYSEKLNAIFQ